MRELIYKEEAIRNVAAAIWHYPNELYSTLSHYQNALDLAEYGLKDVPSAEPERKLELHGDESAIEILSELRSWFSCFDEKEGLAYHALSLAIRAIQRYDLFDDFLETRGCETGRTGKIQYGVSSAPCNWVYPYLKVLSEDKRFSGFVYEIEEQMRGEEDEVD